MTGHETNRMLDCRGESCALMLMRIKEALVGLEPGQALEVLSTDPCAEYDLPEWVRRTGRGEVVSQEVTLYRIVPKTMGMSA